MKKVIVLLIVLSAYGSVAAQTGAGTTNGDLPALEKRVERVEKAISKLPKVSGFLNMRYQWDSSDRTNSFDIRRVRVNLKGELIPSFDYSLQVDFAGSPRILDAYIRYKAARQFNIQAGEFKIPFSMENTYSPTVLETSENSMAISRLCNYSDISGTASNGRDVGIAFYGGFWEKDGYNVLDYNIGVFNGNGINVKDDNRAKDFSGRLTVNPTRHLSLSGSYYYGTFGKQEEGTHNRTRIGAGICWEDQRLIVRSEYIYGKTAGMKSEGVYAVAGYFVHPKFQPVIKYDFFREDRFDASSKDNCYLVGLNYYPFTFMRLQANYTYKDMGKSPASHLLSLQFFAMF